MLISNEFNTNHTNHLPKNIDQSSLAVTKFQSVFSETNAPLQEQKSEIHTRKLESNKHNETFEKPNLKEFITKVYGETPNEIYDRSPKEYEEVCLAASELLYGVVGRIEDTRDWSRIMNSEDPVNETRKQTQELHGAYVEIEAVELTDGSEVQVATLKNNEGMTLRGIDADKVEDIEFMLKNFGLSEGSISSDVISKVHASAIHRSIKQALEKFVSSEV